MNRLSVFTLATLVSGALLAHPTAARAHGDPGTIAAALAIAVLMPAHLGADVPASDDSPTRVVIGWSFQIPFSRQGLFDLQSLQHRIVVGGDLLLRGDTGGRGRLGYRYATHWLFAGAGVSANTSGVTWSPELGVKFAHFEKGEPSSFHAKVRGEIEPDLHGVRSATILLGWNFF